MEGRGRCSDHGDVTLPRDTETVPERRTRATVYRDMWVDPDDDPRERAESGTDERAVLLELRDNYPRAQIIGRVSPRGSHSIVVS